MGDRAAGKAQGVSKNLSEAMDNTFARWGLTARPIMNSRHDVGQCLAISIGLGALFNEDAKAERAWMWRPRKEFRGTAARMVLQGRFEEVLQVVNKERGL